MASDDFQRIWNLLRTLFPSSPRAKSENERIVWKIALQPYAPDDVTGAVMAWARKSKYFPDIADITGKLTAVEDPPEALRGKDFRSGHAWMAPHIRKLAARATEKDAETIHAAGLMTWREAEAKGIAFRDWAQEYWAKFPAGGCACETEEDKRA